MIEEGSSSSPTTGSYWGREYSHDRRALTREGCQSGNKARPNRTGGILRRRLAVWDPTNTTPAWFYFVRCPSMVSHSLVIYPQYLRFAQGTRQPRHFFKVASPRRTYPHLATPELDSGHRPRPSSMTFFLRRNPHRGSLSSGPWPEARIRGGSRWCLRVQETRPVPELQHEE